MKKKLYLILIAMFLIAFLITAKPTTKATVPTVQDSWTAKASMPHARAVFGMVETGGKIYAIGGSLSVGTAISGLSYNEQYDPITDTWATKTDMPTARAYFAIAAYRDLIYCIGGVTGTESYAEPAMNGLWVRLMFLLTRLRFTIPHLIRGNLQKLHLLVLPTARPMLSVTQSLLCRSGKHSSITSLREHGH